MRSNSGPSGQPTGPARTGGWIPRALPRIYLVGTMRAITPGGADLLPRGRKTRGLLAYLCLAQGAPVPRSRFMGLLWHRSTDAQARASLRHALSELNSAVNHQVPGLIEIGRDSVRFDVRGCWVDALAILEASSEAASDASNLIEPCSERLLEDLDGMTPAFDHWLAGERTRFADRVRENFEAELDRLIEQNAKPEVRAATARRLINVEPTHESAVRSLMKAFAEMGDRAQAIREFERCRQALVDGPDLSPTKETTDLYEAVRLNSLQRAFPAIYREHARVELSEPTVASSAATSLTDRTFEQQSDPVVASEHDPKYEPTHEPSIAVLSFRNLTGEPTHDCVADGLVEDLIEALSRVPNFFVISRLSTLAFKNQDRHPREIGNVLGVRYVLSGSLRILADRLRLTIELTDTQLGAALWSARLDERFVDLFEVQDRLSEMIVRRVAPHLHAAEINRIRVKRPDSLETYDLFLRAQENMHNSARTVFETSEALFDAAIAKDPHYAAALAWRAYWHVLRVGQGWSIDPANDTIQADHFARVGNRLQQHGTDGVRCSRPHCVLSAQGLRSRVAPFRNSALDQPQCRTGVAVERSGTCLDRRGFARHRGDQQGDGAVALRPADVCLQWHRRNGLSRRRPVRAGDRVRSAVLAGEPHLHISVSAAHSCAGAGRPRGRGSRNGPAVSGARAGADCGRFPTALPRQRQPACRPLLRCPRNGGSSAFLISMEWPGSQMKPGETGG